MTPKNESKRGGARPGAGRPKSEHKKRQISVHISEDIAERLDAIAKDRQMPRSQVIETLLAVCVFDRDYLPRHSRLPSLECLGR